MVPQEVVEKANEDVYMAFAFLPIGKETLKEWGCSDGRVSACASLGKPFRLYRITPDAFSGYYKGNNVNSLVSSTDTWYFPVIIKDTIRLVLVASKQMLADGTSVVSVARPPINGVDLAKELDRVVRQWPKSEGYDPMLIEAMPGEYLFTVPKKGPHNLTPMATLPYMQKRADYSLLDTIESYMVRPVPAKLKINADLEDLASKVNILAAPWSIVWDATNQELYKDGAWIVEFGSRTIAVKSGLVRGAFDASTQAYNMRPVAIVSDITDIDSGKVETYNYAHMGFANCYRTPSGSFYFKFTAENLSVAKCGEDDSTKLFAVGNLDVVTSRPDLSFHKTIADKQWQDLWVRNAAKYCGTAMKDYCFVPQVLAGKDYQTENSPWTYRYGLIVSKGNMLSPKHKLQTDFVELFNWNTLAKTGNPPNVESPPLNLILKFTPKDLTRLEWQIYATTGAYLRENGRAWESDEQQFYNMVRGYWLETAKDAD
jgi:hypothetical protein